jgi:hypothetical protein
MGKLLAVTFASLLIISCQPRKTLSEQLSEAFSNHLRNIDSSATLDSVHIVRYAAVTQRLGRIIDDSIYNRELMRLQAQLSGARGKNTDADSIRFYVYEINALQTQMDSVTRAIPMGDTTRRAGFLIDCSYYITRNGKKKIDSTVVYVDAGGTLRYTDYMDSSIRRTVQTLN